MSQYLVKFFSLCWITGNPSGHPSVASFSQDLFITSSLILLWFRKHMKFSPEVLIRCLLNVYYFWICTWLQTLKGDKRDGLGFVGNFILIKSGKLAYFWAQSQRFSGLAHYIFLIFEVGVQLTHKNGAANYLRKSFLMPNIE